MMHPLTKWAARLYPRWWRERYGEEFAALLEDSRPGLRGAMDITKGALAIQFTTWAPRRAMAMLMFAGLAVGLAAAFSWPTAYTSRSVLMIRSVQPAASPLSSKNLRGEHLQRIIRDFRVYAGSGEDAVGEMRRHIRISPITVIQRGRTVEAFELTFDHPDRFTAQRVVSALNSLYVATSLGDLPAQKDLKGATVSVLDPASLPINPNVQKSSLVVGGLGTGLFAGSLVGWSLRRRRRLHEKEAVLGRWTGITPTRLAALGAGLGLLIATGLILTNSSRYSSSIVLSVSHGSYLERVAAADDIRAYMLSRTFLTNVIRSLDLYAAERNREPLENVLATMRQNLRIDAQPGESEVRLSFTYSDGQKTSGALEEIASQLIRANRATAQTETTPVLASSSATMPVREDSHWWTVGLLGITLGTAIGGTLGSILSPRLKKPLSDRI